MNNKHQKGFIIKVVQVMLFVTLLTLSAGYGVYAFLRDSARDVATSSAPTVQAVEMSIFAANAEYDSEVATFYTLRTITLALAFAPLMTIVCAAVYSVFHLDNPLSLSRVWRWNRVLFFIYGIYLFGMCLFWRIPHGYSVSMLILSAVAALIVAIWNPNSKASK